MRELLIFFGGATEGAVLVILGMILKYLELDSHATMNAMPPCRRPPPKEKAPPSEDGGA